jgi:magnesium transporter
VDTRLSPTPPVDGAPTVAAPPPAGPPAPAGRPAPATIRTITHAGLTWVDICPPGTAEIAWLQAHYPAFHALHFDDVLSHRQRPKLDVRAGYVFLVTHFPLLDPRTRVPSVGEVDIFLGPDYVITAHSGNLKPLLGLFDRVRDIPQTRAEVMSAGALYLLYLILDPLVDSCFPLLQTINEQIADAEKRIFGGENHRTVYEVALIRRDIIAFRHVIRPEMGVIGDLKHWASKHPPPTGEDLNEQFSDLNDHLAKIVDILDDQKDVIEGLNDTNNALTNAHINKVIRVLTIFSVILLPLSLIAGIYGMNFQSLPMETDPSGFWFTIAAMVIVAAIMLAFFKLQRWL